MSALPVAANRELRAYARSVIRTHRAELSLVVGLQSLGTIAGLFVPWLLGTLVADVSDGYDTVPRTVVLILGFLAAQAVLVRLAMYASARLGEKVLAGLREEFVTDLLTLRPEVIEDADAGDLTTRTTRDIDVLSLTVRGAIPYTMTSVAVIGFTLGALVLVGPLLVLPCLVPVPVLFGAARWYLRRAHAGYLREAMSYSRLTEGLAETVEGARTVEALRLTARRMDRVNEDIAASYATERYTLWLRNIFLPLCDTSYAMPVAVMIIIGGAFYLHGLVSLAAITAAVLYASQLVYPVDQLLLWLNELQSSGAALSRLLGIAQFREPRPDVLSSQQKDIVLRDVRYAYQPGHDVLRGIDLDIRQGEWLAVVGPSGAGKSTLAKLLAGIYEPRTGTITGGGTVALVTQEHHVFRGTLRDNLVIARPDARHDEMAAALTAVDAWDWAEQLGLDSTVGPGGKALDPAQVQQLALARLLLANPDTLILDEATSLLSPGAARHLERSLAAVVRGRTVIAIVHRLHTAMDADRIAVFDDGRITELGTHEELLGKAGGYAALWHAWQGDARSGSKPTRP
ncbi:MAG TPA: ABC transporter ATP-binding protein [Streptosporangiaceae bacterium]|nr:ABC transporter ATP-binding protein [Streptosporangiaceae bacterium]